MKKLLSLTLFALFAIIGFNAHALNEGVVMTLDPQVGTLAEFPQTFTMTFSGSIDGKEITSIKKNTLVGNPVFVIAPESTSKVQCPADFNLEGKAVTVKTQTSIDRTIKGTYKVELRAGGVIFVLEDGSSVKCDADTESIYYNVGDAPTSWTIMDGKVNVSIDPDPATVEEFPETFTMNFSGEGLASLKYSSFSGCPVRVFAPEATSGYVGSSTTVNGLAVTIKNNPSLQRNLPGDYKIEFYANRLTFVFEDGTELKSTVADMIYTVGGDPIVEEPGAKEDVIISGITNIYRPAYPYGDFNLAQRDFEFRITANQTVRPKEGAQVHVTGPDYDMYAPLVYVMGGNATTISTTLGANFPQSGKYNGKYTLTIPAGSMGDEAYLADPETGHTNAKFTCEFTCVGGQDVGEITVGHTFNPIEVTPAPKTKVYDLNNIVLTFSEKVYFNENANLNVGYITDPSSEAYSSYTIAKCQRISDTQVKVVPEKAMNVDAEYRIIFPEGFFYNQEYKDNNNSGNISVELTYTWVKRVEVVYIDLVSSFPAKNSKIDKIPVGGKIWVNTTNNDIAKSLSFTINSYVMDNDMATAKKVISGETTTKNEQGYLTWVNEGETIIFDVDHYYEVIFTIKNAEGGTCCDETFEFDGKELEPDDPVVTANVISTTPAANASVESFGEGTCIVIDTDNNEAVAKLEFTITEKNEGAAKVLEGTSTEKTGEGSICWNNTGDVITFNKGTNYVLAYTIYAADNKTLATGNVEFAGAWETTTTVLSTIPAADATVENFGEGTCIVIDTDNNEAVAKLSFTITEKNENAAKVLEGTSTEKTGEGSICWNNTGDVVTFYKDMTYVLAYTIYGADDKILATGEVEFAGATEKDGVNSIDADAAEYPVFNLQGIRVSNENLPAGLYIINGKKVVIRK